MRVPQITISFTLIVQIAATSAQFMMEPSAKLFAWPPELVSWLHSLIAAMQGVQAVVAHYNTPRGERLETKSDVVMADVTTITKEQTPTVVKEEG